MAWFSFVSLLLLFQWFPGGVVCPLVAICGLERDCVNTTAIHVCVCVCVCVCVMLFRRGRGGDGRLGRQSFAADALEGAVPAGARQEPQGSRGT